MGTQKTNEIKVPVACAENLWHYCKMLEWKVIQCNTEITVTEQWTYVIRFIFAVLNWLSRAIRQIFRRQFSSWKSLVRWTECHYRGAAFLFHIPEIPGSISRRFISYQHFRLASAGGITSNVTGLRPFPSFSTNIFFSVWCDVTRAVEKI
jgi:hypothetical protein